MKNLINWFLKLWKKKKLKEADEPPFIRAWYLYELTLEFEKYKYDEFPYLFFYKGKQIYRIMPEARVRYVPPKQILNPFDYYYLFYDKDIYKTQYDVVKKDDKIFYMPIEPKDNNYIGFHE